MTEPKLLSPGMIAAATLATPVMAGKHHLSARRVAKDTKMPAQHPPGVSNHVRDHTQFAMSLQAISVKRLRTHRSATSRRVERRTRRSPVVLLPKRSRERNRSHCAGRNDHNRVPVAMITFGRCSLSL